MHLVARYVSVRSWQMSAGLKYGLVISLLPFRAIGVGYIGFL